MTLDIADTVAPKSDQLNAEDLLSGERTFTITEVRVTDSPEQPVSVYLAEFPNNRPWKPSKTSRRILMMGWGNKSAEYAGRRITLYRDPEVKFGGDKVGGIKIRAMSHLPGNKRLAVALTVTRGKRAPYVVEPLPDDAPTSSPQTSDHLTTLTNAFNESGITERADRLAKVGEVLGREVKSPADLSEAEIQQVIDALKADLEQPFPTADQPEQS